MPDDRDQYEDDDGQTEGMVPRSHIRDLEAKAKERDDLAARLAAMERVEAFRTAGIDPNDPKGQYFFKGYDGELSADAIKAAATEAGFLAPPGQQNTPPPGPDSMERIYAASDGAGTPPAADWRDAIAEAERITDPRAREDAILSVVERYGGLTTRQLQ